MPDGGPSALPDELLYAPEHEWAALGEDGIVTTGITDYAQAELGEIVWVAIPEVGRRVVGDAPFAEVESLKTISDVYSPCAGEVVDVNGELESQPTLVNEAPYTEGWIARIRPSDPSELEAMLDAGTYRALLEA